MNIIQKMTIRHLRENKRRSLVTILGVIISVAMITAVTTLGSSFLDLMIRQDIAKNGEWHVQYMNPNEAQLDAIRTDDSTKAVTLFNDGYAELTDSKNLYKPYIYMRNYNTVGFENFAIELTDGRLPQREGEVVISEAIRQNAQVTYQIGDRLTLDVGQRVDETGRVLTQDQGLMRDETKMYERLIDPKAVELTVVGTMARPSWEPLSAPGYTVIGYIDEKQLADTSVNALVALNEVDSSIYENTNTFVEKEQIEGVSYNAELLRYYGVTDDDGLHKTLYGFLTIIMTVIVVGSVSLIFNAFSISVSERSRYLGMLASVGATKRQKRNSVYMEGTLIGAISIPIGLLAGIFGIWVTFLFVNTFVQDALDITESFEVVVTPLSLLLTLVVSILTIFISCWLPARRASKITAIDAIRQTQDVRLTRKQVKTSSLVRRLFGLEAEIGLKNTKRNRKRYLVTVFSLTMSIILFLVVSYFTSGLKQSLEMTQRDYSYDLYLSSSQFTQADYDRYLAIEDVTSGTYFRQATLRSFVETNRLPSRLTEQDDLMMLTEDGTFGYYVSLYQLDDASFDAYLEQIGAISSRFDDSDAPGAVLIDELTYQDEKQKTFIQTKTIEASLGDRLSLSEENATGATPSDRDVTVAALTDTLPDGMMSSSLGWLDVIVREGTFDETAFNKAFTYQSPIITLNTKDPDGVQAVIEAEQNADIYLTNVSQQREQQEQMLLLFSVFAYGFIVLISLISVANIFNTISTSISLRRREFAMLRSVGMTPKGFNKMVYYESIVYGAKALAYGIPLSIAVMYAIHRTQQQTFVVPFALPWGDFLFVTVVIFIIVGSSMLYAISKVKSDNIIDQLKQEND